jgi:hypothetical protein
MSRSEQQARRQAEAAYRADRRRRNALQAGFGRTRTGRSRSGYRQADSGALAALRKLLR